MPTTNQFDGSNSWVQGACATGKPATDTPIQQLDPAQHNHVIKGAYTPMDTTHRRPVGNSRY